jgi:hypothetical protein
MLTPHDPPVSVAPDDVGRDMPDPSVLLCADCIDAYRNGIEPGGTACEARAIARERGRLGKFTTTQQRDFEAAHAEGLHDGAPREFCPDCERSA